MSDAQAAANRGLGSFYAALRDIGNQRVRNLGILLVIVVVFSIWAIASDGWDLFFQRVTDGIDNGFIYAAMAQIENTTTTRRRIPRLRTRWLPMSRRAA